MQLTPEQKQQIKDLYDTMQTNDDLSLMVNYIKSVIFAEGNQVRSGKQKLIKLQTITYFANTKLPHARYKAFTIPKKRGGERTLHAPVGALKTIQRCLNVAFQVMAESYVHRAATGFVLGKSIVDNARPHVGKPFIYNLDLKDFFPSIGFGRIKACLMLPPFNLTGEREPLAFVLANLCCERSINDIKRSFLPQGAPTSPVLTNIVCNQLDRRLSGLAKRFRLTYTRYADDLTFSSYRDAYSPNGEFCRELNRIITEQGFTINSTKTRLQQSGYRQEVTGLIVNDRVNVSRQYWREIKFLLNLWGKKDETTAQECYWSKYYPNAPVTKRPILPNVLMGKLLYMRMVRGAEDELYKRYQQKYLVLVGKLAKIEPVRDESTESAVEKPSQLLMQVIALYKKGDIAGAIRKMDEYEAQSGDHDR